MAETNSKQELKFVGCDQPEDCCQTRERTMRVVYWYWVMCLWVTEGVVESGGKEARKKVVATRRLKEELPPLILASAVTAALTYPLDFARAMAMTSAVTGSKGVQVSFTKGLVPELAKGTASRIVKFGGYPLCLALVCEKAFFEKRPTAARACAGALATVPEIALITPLEVTKLALQLDAVGAGKFGNDALVAARALLKAAGPSSVYACHFALQCRQAVWTAVYFSTIPLLEAACRNAFAAGLAAGAVGALANNPIDVCRSVAQKDLLGKWIFGTMRPPASRLARAPYVGPTLDAGRRVLRSKGPSGLWAGAGFKAAHLGLGGAFMAVLQPAFSKLWSNRRSFPLFSSSRQSSTSASSRHVAAFAVRGGFLPAGYNPFGFQLTALGQEFLDTVDGFRDSDLGRLLAALRIRKRKSSLKSEWLELVRFSKSAQATRIYQHLDKLLDLALRARLID